MAFKMGFDLSQGKVIAPGIYTVRLNGFRVRTNKNKDGVNFNAQMKVINHPDADGTPLYDTLSNKAGFTLFDFAHAFGMELEEGENGQYHLPGDWDGDAAKFKEEDPSTWVYAGPLVGRDAQVEVASDTYEGKESSKIKRYLCAVAGCDQKHSTDLLRRK